LEFQSQKNVIKEQLFVTMSSVGHFSVSDNCATTQMPKALATVEFLNDKES
jgi:hypothetical protein